jgi:hypothetical protein
MWASAARNALVASSVQRQMVLLEPPGIDARLPGLKNPRSDSFRKECTPRPLLLFQKMRGWLSYALSLRVVNCRNPNCHRGVLQLALAATILVSEE